MENTNFNETADNAVWNNEAEEKLSARLAGLKAGAQEMEDVLADDLIKQVLTESKLFHVKTGNFVKDNRNLIGGGIGLALAVGLELVSPTGSKKSAAVAAITGGAVLAFTAPVLKVAPQSTMVSAAAGIMTAYVGMCGGRITADYFPGNLGDDE